MLKPTKNPAAGFFQNKRDNKESNKLIFASSSLIKKKDSSPASCVRRSYVNSTAPRLKIRHSL
jgi:hypothetical protein